MTGVHISHHENGDAASMINAPVILISMDHLFTSNLIKVRPPTLE